MLSVAFKLFKTIAFNRIKVALVFGGSDNLNAFSISFNYLLAVTGAEIAFGIKVIQFLRSELSFHLVVSPLSVSMWSVLFVVFITAL